MAYHLAIDIGASSGRHLLGHVENGHIETEEVYRFENKPVTKGGQLCWDVEALWHNILAGMAECGRLGKPPLTVGIDTWGVDYVLLDADDRMLGNAVCYRDKRTEGMDAVIAQIYSEGDLYQHTGIQKQPFNTIYQLAAQQQNEPQLLKRAKSLLLMPDYLHFLLTGVKNQEYTNATTTGLVNAQSKTWDDEILDVLGYPRKLFGALSLPGEALGPLRPKVEAEVGYSCTVVLPATHDTASAFLATPLRDAGGITLSSGTWSLLGVENAAANTTKASRKANFTNEGGYAGRYRYLKNIMGLWMVQSIRREMGASVSFAELEAAARANASFQSRVDVNDEVFLAPVSMSEAVRAVCAATNQPVPQNNGELMQCVYASLADSYRQAVEILQVLTGRTFTHIQVVGGGSKDGYLNELTAKSTGLPVYAGPTEATALGNLLVQMIAGGEFDSLEAARAAVRNSFPIKEVMP